MGWLDDELRPAVVYSGGKISCSVRDGLEHTEAIQGMKRGVAVRYGVRGAFYWPVQQVEGMGGAETTSRWWSFKTRQF
jgi:hypothetical protein